MYADHDYLVGKTFELKYNFKKFMVLSVEERYPYNDFKFILKDLSESVKKPFVYKHVSGFLNDFKEV